MRDGIIHIVDGELYIDNSTIKDRSSQNLRRLYGRNVIVIFF